MIKMRLAEKLNAKMVKADTKILEKEMIVEARTL
jgi:hypothetical protein